MLTADSGRLIPDAVQFLSTQFTIHFGSGVWAVDLETAGQSVVLLSAVCAALGYIYRSIRKAWRVARAELREAISNDTHDQFERIHDRLTEGDQKFQRIEGQLGKVAGQVELIDSKVGAIEKEVTLNSGSSLKDAVTEIRQYIQSTEE